MPFMGLGLHILIALLFAVHAVRTRQQLYWLLILFSFPLLGSVVYFLAIYMPDSRLEYGARKAVSAAARSLDPGRDLREAQAAFDYTPTAQNQMRLAKAQLEVGDASAAAATYEACLSGAFSADPEIRVGAARASLACGRVREAIGHLEFIMKANAGFRAEEVALLYAQALGASGRKDDAKTAFEDALARFGSFAVRAEYAIWAASAGETQVASRLRTELQDMMKHWNRHTRDINGALIRRLNAAFGA